MKVYKIFRSGEMDAFEAAGETEGAPIDVADGYIHFSTAETVAETAQKYFFGENGLWLLTLVAEDLGDALKWEEARGGVLFPHLYRRLTSDDVLTTEPLPLGPAGHVFPDDLS